MDEGPSPPGIDTASRRSEAQNSSIHYRHRWRRRGFRREGGEVGTAADAKGALAEVAPFDAVDPADLEAVADHLEVVEVAARLRLEALTLYAFSVENWKRPRTEVATLMLLLKRFLRQELDTLMRNDIRFQPIGRIGELAPAVQAELRHAVEATAPNRGLRFQVALNYGGRAEIVDACRRLIAESLARGAAPEIGEEEFSRHLYTRDLPDPDLLIRTSGEARISNFLLWQLAYTEMYFTPILWPDFRRREALLALLEYQKRERRFGQVPTAASPQSQL